MLPLQPFSWLKCKVPKHKFLIKCPVGWVTPMTYGAKSNFLQVAFCTSMDSFTLFSRRWTHLYISRKFDQKCIKTIEWINIVYLLLPLHMHRMPVFLHCLHHSVKDHLPCKVFMREMDSCLCYYIHMRKKMPLLKLFLSRDVA